MDITTALLILIGFMVIYIAWIKINRKINQLLEGKLEKAKDLPYKLKKSILTDSELAFYRALKDYYKGDGVILGKIALKDVMFVGRDVGKDYMTYFNKISKKHFDFLICDEKTLAPMLAIELDEKSHNAKSAQQRDEFKNAACESAGIPLIRIQVKSNYTKEYLDAGLMVPLAEMKVNKSAEELPICPKCGAQMVLRKHKSGERAGQEFYGCSNYPKCRETMPYMV